VKHREIEVSDRHRRPPKKDKVCLLDNLCGQKSVNLREVELDTGVRIKMSGFHSQLLWGSVKDQDLTEHTNFRLRKVAEKRQVMPKEISGLAQAKRYRQQEGALMCIPENRSIDPHNSIQKELVGTIRGLRSTLILFQACSINDLVTSKEEKCCQVKN